MTILLEYLSPNFFSCGTYKSNLTNFPGLLSLNLTFNELLHRNYFNLTTLLHQVHSNYQTNYITTFIEQIHFNYFNFTTWLELLLIHYFPLTTLQYLPHLKYFAFHIYKVLNLLKLANLNRLACLSPSFFLGSMLPQYMAL